MVPKRFEPKNFRQSEFKAAKRKANPSDPKKRPKMTMAICIPSNTSEEKVINKLKKKLLFSGNFLTRGEGPKKF